MFLMQFRQQTSALHEHLSCEILLTSFCNMNCTYCIAKKLPDTTMNREIGQKVIDMFLYLSEGGKTIEITFTGGEPLSNFSVLKYLTSYAEKHVREAQMQP
ncbi:4Fe-4S cluster-binding domain-containing protein, partial [bacterium]